MGFLYENPLHLFLAGTLLVGSFGAFAWVTGSRLLWGLAALSLLLTALAMFVESRVVTDREQLQNSLEQMVVCVRTNDLPGLKRFLSARFPENIRQLDDEFPRYTFHGCSISRRKEPEFDDPRNPRTATLEFVAMVNVDASRSHYQFSGLVMRGVTLHFVKEDDGVWRVSDYEHYETGTL